MAWAHKWMRLNASGERGAKAKKKCVAVEMTEEEASYQIPKKTVQKAKRKVYTRAWGAVHKFAKKEGKRAEEAKALARNAGCDAVRAWSDIVGTWVDSTRACSVCVRER